MNLLIQKKVRSQSIYFDYTFNICSLSKNIIALDFNQ